MTYQNYAAMEAPKKKQLMPNSNRYKTELCKNWQNGTCEYHDKCIFAHGYHEMRPKMYPNFRTQLCKNYTTSRWCPYGSRCQFIHDDSAVTLNQKATPDAHAHAHTHVHPQGDQCNHTHQNSKSGKPASSSSSSSSSSSKVASRRGSFKSYKDAIADPTNYGNMTSEGLVFEHLDEEIDAMSTSTCSSPRNGEQRLRPRLQAFEEITKSSLNKSHDGTDFSELELNLKKRRSNSA